MPASKKRTIRYTKPADQVSQEAWEEREKARLEGKPDPTIEGRSFVVEGNDTEGYVGVSPEYATHASDLTAPLVKTKDFLSEHQLADAELVRINRPNFGKTEVKEDAKEEDKGDDGKSNTPESTTPPTPAAPAAPASGDSNAQSSSTKK